MKMPRTHLRSQEFVFIIGRYRHAEWDCNCILFILKMITHGAMSKRLTLLRSSRTKISSICRILSRVIIQGRSQKLKKNFEKLLSLKVFKILNYYPFSVLSWQNFACLPFNLMRQFFYCFSRRQRITQFGSQFNGWMNLVMGSWFSKIKRL